MRILLSLVFALMLLHAIGGLEILERAVRGVVEMNHVLEQAAKVGM